jgi:hypothetical protein
MRLVESAATSPCRTVSTEIGISPVKPLTRFARERILGCCSSTAVLFCRVASSTPLQAVAREPMFDG